MSTSIILIVFIIGYLLIALEGYIKTSKSAVALIMCVLLWVIYSHFAVEFVPTVSANIFNLYLGENSYLTKLPLDEQVTNFVVNFQIVDHLGKAAEVLLFLIGAMTIVNLIDKHGGFSFITSIITTKNKYKLLWIIATTSFFMSALLDNMTATIIMVMLVRKLISNKKERWLFASLIVITANSGGAWSPIGDITTIMLWANGNVTTVPLIGTLFLPSLVSAIIPVAIGGRVLHHILTAPNYVESESDRPESVTKKDSLRILIIGVLSLVLIPVFKEVTQLPPFLGVMLGLGVLWVYTEMMYNRKRDFEESKKVRIVEVLRDVDLSTILFFLGVLMSVSVLESTGLLKEFSLYLDAKVNDVFIINTLIGLLSSIVDNVPLVASAMGMYSIVEPDALLTATNPEYLKYFVADGHFWHLLAYCSGVGGSILIIGSTAGVVAMGIEKISFMWYFKNFSFLALTGYVAGIIVYYIQFLIFQ